MVDVDDVPLRGRAQPSAVRECKRGSLLVDKAEVECRITRGFRHFHEQYVPSGLKSDPGSSSSGRALRKARTSVTSQPLSHIRTESLLPVSSLTSRDLSTAISLAA